MADALAGYDSRRRPAVRKVADLSGRLGLLAAQTNISLRWLRDRVLMPIANRMTDERAYAAILQESPAEPLETTGR